MLTAHKWRPLSVLTAADEHPVSVPGRDENRWKGKVIVVSVKNDQIVPVRVMGLLLITAFLL